MEFQPIEETRVPLEKLVEDMDATIRRTLGTEIPVSEESRSDYLGHRVIRFVVEEIFMAIPLLSALEIGRQPRITPLPNLPGWVLGVSNIRGEIISLVDIKIFFGLAGPGLRRNQRFIVVHNPDMKVGFLVDRIIGIYSLDRVTALSQDLLYRKSDGDTLKWTEFVSAIVPLENTVLNILDVEKILSHPRMNAFRNE